jgi:hypothetical protein
MMKKVKMYIDFYRYLVWINPKSAIKWVISLMLLILSTVIFIQTHNNGIVFEGVGIASILLFVISVVKLLYDIFARLREIHFFTAKNRALKIVRHSHIVKGDDLIPLNEIVGKTSKHTNYETLLFNHKPESAVIVSKELNTFLRANDVKLVLKRSHTKKVNRHIKTNLPILKPFFEFTYYHSKMNNQLFFNDHLLSLASDPSVNKQTLDIYKGNYYQYFLTNSISTGAIFRESDEINIFDVRQFYPCVYDKGNHQFVLNPLSTSIFSNTIGASTIAITKDHHIVIRRQGSKNMQSRGLLAPTGSGSIRFKDLKNESLFETITSAMQRELLEENPVLDRKINVNTMGESIILGYFRWLKLGGKPEFVGLTFLNVDYHELSINEEELKINEHSSTCLVYEIQDLDDLIKVIDDWLNLEDLSIPLWVNLICLKQFIIENPEKLKVFINLKT